MSVPHVVAELRKNARETLRVTLDIWQEHNLIDMRLFIASAVDDRSLMPTKKGLTVAVTLLPALREALAEAEATARLRGWLE
jgi:hypothetical protein